MDSNHLPPSQNEFDLVFQNTFLVTKVHDSFEEDNNKTVYSDVTLTELTSPQPSRQTSFTLYPKDSQDVQEFFNCFPSLQVGSHRDSQICSVYQKISKETAFPVPDIRESCQIIDEIVETRAKELHDGNPEYNHCFMSTFSPLTKLSEDHWSCGTQSSSSPSSVTLDSSSSECGGKIQTSRILRKWHKHSYGLDIDRKKEQNKNASNRYRQKKKQEMRKILSEEQELSNRNMALQSALAERECEVKYLKKLIRESYHKNIPKDLF